jgi:Rieske 2Fe-2S protein
MGRCEPWKVKDQTTFTAAFKQANYRFKFFDLTLECGGDPVDVEFNYKDLAHLTVVHNTFDMFYSYLDDDVMTCVVMQSLFGIKFPMTHVSVQIGPGHLFFHDSFLFMMMTSEVTATPLPDHRSLVRTRYGVGAPRFLLPLTFPILKRLLTRNFHILMEGDVPIRDRRGELRRWGFEFAEVAYRFPATLNLAARNVLPPLEAALPTPTILPLASISEGAPTFVNRSDHYGLQLFRRNDMIEAFPRMCPHEGACLDQQSHNRTDVIACPWHGRTFAPVVKIPIAEGDIEVCSTHHRFRLDRDTLRIDPLIAPTGANWASAEKSVIN